MELSQLRMFKTVSDIGSIARAAELLHCVPSNITARLKSLEHELGMAREVFLALLQAEVDSPTALKRNV